jgi:hypothetical protein
MLPQRLGLTKGDEGFDPIAVPAALPELKWKDDDCCPCSHNTAILAAPSSASFFFACHSLENSLFLTVMVHRCIWGFERSSNLLLHDPASMAFCWHHSFNSFL